MEKTVLSVQGLSHSYGELRAVDNISFDIKQGQVFSFLGPNGAGKTTINCSIHCSSYNKAK
jgi:ABC-2 type transport system ATP-binding protein